MSEEYTTIDIRGEPCGMPLLRVEKFIKENKSRNPFVVLGDDPQTMDSMELLAARYSYLCEISREDSIEWRALFRPASESRS